MTAASSTLAEPRPAVDLGYAEHVFAQTSSALDAGGFAVIEGAVSDDWIERARREVRQEVTARKARFFSLIRPADSSASVLGEVANDAALGQLLGRLVRHASPDALIEPDAPYSVLRVIAGRSGTDGAYQFHYDSSVITVVVPIFIPERTEGPAGQLAVFGNRRPLRRTVIGNVIEKVAMQNRWAWRRAERDVTAHPGRHIRQLAPGNLYLFWGYRTYHGNLPCGFETLRATMLLHVGDPHGASRITRGIRALRARIEARRRGE